MDETNAQEPKNDHVIGDEVDFKIKGAATRVQHQDEQQDARRDHCTICLQPITERAVATPCNHLAFDFICLVSWLQNRETCPLCNATIAEVQYDWRSPDDYKSYRIRQQREVQPVSTDSQRPCRRIRRDINGNSPLHRSSAGGAPDDQSDPGAVEDRAVAHRRRVYHEGLYSLHVGANSISQYRDFTPQEFANSASLQRRARTFLRRELQVFTYSASVGRMRNREFVLEYIVAVLKKFDPKEADGRAEDFVSEFLGRDNARLLLHELQAWLRSPYESLQIWDQNVQYVAHRPDQRHLKDSSAG